MSSPFVPVITKNFAKRLFITRGCSEFKLSSAFSLALYWPHYFNVYFLYSFIFFKKVQFILFLYTIESSNTKLTLYLKYSILVYFSLNAMNYRRRFRYLNKIHQPWQLNWFKLKLNKEWIFFFKTDSDSCQDCF